MAADDKTEIIRAPDPVAVGTQLSGTYELDKRIASGGMGEVYRGHNIQTGDPVAIKIVLPEFARDQTILSLFRKEASILNHLFHEAIVRYHVFAIDQAIGRPYLAMEFVDGVSLADMMERGPMDPENARRLLVRLASGLAVAHEAGVIHRDLSPDNIVLPGGKVERAKIIDFGIARSASVGGETLLGGSFAGKYNFVSPEQLGMAGGEVTERSDIYSLGLVLAAVLRGKTINMTGSQVDVIEKRRLVPDLTGIDPRMRPVLEAMLQPDPRNRPTSMMEIVEGLRDVEPARARSVWDDAPAATLPPPHVAAPPIAEVTAAGSPPLPEDGWPPETSRTPAPWRTPDATAPLAASIVGRPGDTADFGTPPPTLDAARPRKSGGLGLALVVVAGLAGISGGGAWFGGYLDDFLPPRSTKPQPEPAAEQSTPPKPAEPAPTQPEQPATEQPKPEQPATPQPPATEQPKPEQPANEQPKPVPAEPAQPPATDPTEPVPDQPAAEPSQPLQQQQPAEEQPAPQPPATEPPATQPPADPQPPTVEPEQPQQPAEEAVTPPVTEPAEDPRLAWLKSYPGGDCFFASALNETDGKLHIEGFGSTVTPFESMLEAFKSAFPSDPEPDIGVRLIAPKQCPATAFMADLRDAAVAAPKLDLAKDVLFRGDPMAGGVALEPDRTTYLLLVDHDGIAHNLEGILKRSGDRAAFSVQLGLSAGEGVGKSPLPQMLVAFSSSSPVAAMQITKPVPAGELFPAIESELRDRGINAAAVARYFRIRG
jgi:serine/threonine protein kinase